MPAPIRYESTQEPADAEERELMDPEAWDWGSAETRPGGGRVQVEVSARFSRDEYHALVALAARQGLEPAELTRRLVLDRLAAERWPRNAAVRSADTA
jgi:hypothetical protein